VKNRRDFVKTAGLGAAALAASGAADTMPKNVLPRWRGFNLLPIFYALYQKGKVDIVEDDFRMIRDLGFDFVRIPFDYWFFVDSDWLKTGKMNPRDILKVKLSTFDDLDRIVELGRKYSLHVNLNMHRAPGYCVLDHSFGDAVEPLSLWRDKDAENAFLFYWDMIARRYNGVSPQQLSFNLVNEPRLGGRDGMTREDYRRVMTRATQKIREYSPDRIIIIDGLNAGNDVVYEMIPAGVAQSIHGYLPWEISHYRTFYVDKNSDFPVPSWPGAVARRRNVWPRGTREELRALGAAGAPGNRCALRRDGRVHQDAARYLSQVDLRPA
jgi:endoglucanase